MLFFWMIVIVFALLLYVVLDGYDLGIGVLTLFQPDAARRRQMVEVVGNVWDGNETWILLIAMGLWGGFPDAYATALPGLYIPLVVMLFALIFRGFSVEMTLHRAASDRAWTRLFGIGSLVAAFAQGVLFGGLLCGVTVHDQRFAGATWDFLGHGYGVLTGLPTVALFCLAGAAMLQAKTVGVLRDQMAALVRRLTLATVWAVTLSAALLPVATSARLNLDGVGRWLPFAYAVLVAAAGFGTAYWRAGPYAGFDPVPFGGRRRDRRPGGAGRPVLPPDRAAVGDAAGGRVQPQHLGLPGHRDQRVPARHHRLSRLRQLGFPRAPAAGRRRGPWRPPGRAVTALEWVSTFGIGLVAMYVGPPCSATSGSRCSRFTWGRRPACSFCSWPRLTSLRCGASPRPTTSARRRLPPRRSWRRSAAAAPPMPSRWPP